ncbi:glycosyltransferase family 2 protein [Polynucleobacter sp. 15G-AUS-farblos]|uniref:glycosyltransferase family 2 protein n=1 Tax=Polynucleobacter sp. 15G-AUS-farblos TaxID=2689094 RepID=UPI001C0BF7C8|nr:glycosyltransferase family 2 protein [Polynucleobacter sp. 15G-AUS-farblos]
MYKAPIASFRPLQFKLSIVVPCHNEAIHLNDFIKALKATVAPITPQFEILLINDGSRDDTRSVALGMLEAGQVRYIEFSRNFGKEAALMAGIDHADGDAVVLIDADFQHPLEKLTEMASLWQQGYDMIYGIIVNRSEEGLFKRLGTNLFYGLMRFSEVPIPQNAGDFRWLDRKVVQALRSLPERNRFMKGLYSWVGFKSVALEFIPEERKGGVSSFNPSRLISLALAGLTSFSTMPLRIWTALGFIVSIMAILYGIYIIYLTITEGNSVSGWPTLTVALMFFSGVQLFSIGILGEYIARIFNEVKQRPLYVIADDQSSQ